MKHSRLIVAAAVLALGLVPAACSSSPDAENVGVSTSEALVKQACPNGEEARCMGTVCSCVPVGSSEPTSVCSPLPLTFGAKFVVAWAVVPRNGTCADIPGLNGVWAEIDTVPAGFPSFPLETQAQVPNAEDGIPPNCADVFPHATYPTCCTYVWWPDGFPTAADMAMQDNIAICTQNTAEEEQIGENSG